MKWSIGFGATLIAVMGGLGCRSATPPVAPVSPPPTQPSSSPPSSHGAEPDLADPDIVALELATVVTTSDDELVTFLEHATRPQTLSSSVQADLRLQRPPNGAAQRTKIDMPPGTWTCFAQRTSSDGRAVVIRKSRQGYLAPPIAWMAEVIDVRGPKDDDARAWYLAISRRLATTGHATGLVRFRNENASAIEFELRAVEPNDTELVATSHFMKAGQYDADAWGPRVEGAENIRTRKMNGHQGVSVFDLLRKLRGSAPTSPASPTST